MFRAWVPYLMLVAFVLVWGIPSVKLGINRWTDNLLPAWVPTLGAAASKTAAPGSCVASGMTSTLALIPSRSIAACRTGTWSG